MPDDMTARHGKNEDGLHIAGLANAHGPHRAYRHPRGLKIAGVAALVIAVTTAAWGIIARRNADHALRNWTDTVAVPAVRTVLPSSNSGPRSLALPGTVAAYYEAPIYARVSGYLHGWYQDIGARVKAGQVLATIDTPDLDQQLVQAEADLASARANAALATLTARRWHALLASNAVSVQSADEKAGNAQAAEAAVNAQVAHVNQLRALSTFKRLTAPFDGIVTARNTDIGALINAGSSATSPLFRVADMHEMRVYVRVPQAYASALTTGMKATLTEPQYPGEKFPATLATTSRSVAADSRTVLVELMAPNPDGKLWPGTYADVRFALPPDRGVLLVPANALIFRSHGAEVATAGAGGRVAMKSITIGRNLGAEIEVTAGLAANDHVIVAPPDTLEDGESVDVLPPAPDNGAAGPAHD
jgi:RND family efflux transporter MFP subunit